MRVTVCEMNEDRALFERDWERLVAHVRTERSELVLLPEFPFSTWFPESPYFADQVWNAGVESHEAWLKRLVELSPAAVLSARPVNRDGRRVDEGFVWDGADGYRAAHLKHYVPDEESWWEATWFESAAADFTPIQVGPALVGFQICTDIWAMGRAQRYGKQGVHVIVSPRASGIASLDMFLAGARVAAYVSGAFVLSANRAGANGDRAQFGGQGWIVGPNGDVLALTSAERPFATMDIDLDAAVQAKHTYPRGVLE